MRPPSPSMKLLAGSNDAKSAINLVISQVASNDVTPSIQALAQVSTITSIREVFLALKYTLHLTCYYNGNNFILD